MARLWCAIHELGFLASVSRQSVSEFRYAPQRCQVRQPKTASRSAGNSFGSSGGVWPAPEPVSGDGKDAFHRVPFIPGEVRDAVERVPTKLGARCVETWWWSFLDRAAMAPANTAINPTDAAYW